MMRACLAACAVVAAIALSGCCRNHEPSGESMRMPAPIKSGVLVSGTLWSKPVGSTGQNTGNSPEPGSRIEVYDGFIIVTAEDGTQTITPHGWYTDLRLK